MTLSRRRNAFCLAIVLFVSAAIASAQAPSDPHDTSVASVMSYTLAQQMPADPEALIGTQENVVKELVKIGLGTNDARAIAYAAGENAKCDYFATHDLKDLNQHKVAIETLLPNSES
jgi:hypothetical protein